MASFPPPNLSGDGGLDDHHIKGGGVDLRRDANEIRNLPDIFQHIDSPQSQARVITLKSFLNIANINNHYKYLQVFFNHGLQTGNYQATIAAMVYFPFFLPL